MPKIYKALNSLWRKVWPKHSRKYYLLFLGLNNSGKTTLVARLSLEQEDTLKHITPTRDFTEKHLKINGIKICMRDISGQPRVRKFWHLFFQQTKALIYVIDSTDGSRLSEARCELCNVLLDERMRNVPLLVLANKQDMSGAMPASFIAELLGLKHLEGRAWQVLECSALTCTNIDLIVDWMFKNLKKLEPPSYARKILFPALIFGRTCPLDKPQQQIETY
ncbi:ADP-ribosylation factor-like protein 3 [Drosophila busckii]|uniref:ADP-ribosylation factor-like protein 3 n=1 Tax=Drosophila busckii TaxID=30019 RepID=UPI00083F0434|nr:ADP-ribosylation factor-like protein 3 [Drosophila busckii]